MLTLADVMGSAHRGAAEGMAASLELADIFLLGLVLLWVLVAAAWALHWS